MTSYYISGDIGGTKTLLQATELKDGDAQVCCERRYASQEYACFSDMLREFLRETMTLGIGSNPVSACFAVAGPITQQVASLTNLPWVMDSAAIAKEFSIPVVKLINDFKTVVLKPCPRATWQRCRQGSLLPWSFGLRLARVRAWVWRGSYGKTAAIYPCPVKQGTWILLPRMNCRIACSNICERNLAMYRSSGYYQDRD